VLPRELSMAIALDTLAYARRLREAGVSEREAEAHAEALAAALTDSVVTKQDLREFGLHLDARFAKIESEFARIDARFERIDDRFGALCSELDERFGTVYRQLDEREKRQDARFARIDDRFGALSSQLDEREKRQDARFDAKLADLERRMTMRLGAIMVAGVGTMSALATLL
jgi:hypothetical protein